MMITAFMAALLVGDERLPVSLKDDEVLSEPAEAAQDDKEPAKGQKEGLSIGPVAGYLKARDADDGTWFGGVQLRLRFARILALEGSITYHKDSFQDGDIDIIQYPVQVSALLFPIPDSPIEPYGVFGAGWYYTRVEFECSV
jgi:hypothetical protein